MEYRSYEPFSVCFNMMKMKYRDYDEDLSKLGFLSPNDKINVFINVETILKYISMIPDLENKMMLQRDIVPLFVSNFINVIGHYKAFFVRNGLDTKVYLYSTDLLSHLTNGFSQVKYNEDFRSYYLLKYQSNPKYRYMCDKLCNDIIPELRTIIDFIPNAYYISGFDIDGSLIPYIVSNFDKERKNLVIGGELFETQYSLLPNFVNHCIRRGPNAFSTTSSIEGYLVNIYKKKPDEISSLISLCENYNIYVGLLSVLGDKSRSIDGIPGVGLVKYEKMIKEAVDSARINVDTVTPELLSTMFSTQSNNYDSEFAKDFINNFYCLSVKKMYDELTEASITSIKNQITDHVDVNGLIQLNQTKFFNHPLILENITL